MYVSEQAEVIAAASSTLAIQLQSTRISTPNSCGPDPFLCHPARLGTQHSLPRLSFLMKLLSFIPRGSLLFPLRGEPCSQPSRRPRSPRTLWSVTCSCGQASCGSPMSRVTHSTHALLSFVSAPVSFCTSLGSHFSLLFLFFCDLCPLPSSLAAADFSDRSWHVPTAP